MSTRTNIRPQYVLTAGNMTGNLTTAPTILPSPTRFAYQANWTGTSPVGTISIQGCLDYALNPNGTVANAGNWTNLTFSYNGSPTSSISISGNTGTVLIDAFDTAIYAVRLIYTAGSGTGSMSVLINAKVS